MSNNDAEILLGERNQAARELRAVPDLRQYRSIYRTRLAFRILSFIVSLLIIVALSNSIKLYRSTKDLRNPYHDGSGSFPVWPQTLKLYPTYMLLGAALVAELLSLVLLLASFQKEVRRMTKVGNQTTLWVSSICLVCWIVVTAYYGSWDTKETNWDLLSWSCSHQDPKYDYQNIDFSDECTKMRAAFWASVGLAGLEAVNLVIFALWWLKTRRSRGYTQMEEGKDNSNNPLIVPVDVSGFSG